MAPITILLTLCLGLVQSKPQFAGLAEVDWNCGGSLINEKYVLTGAHCVTSLPSEYTVAKVRLGEHIITSDNDCKEFGYADDCVGPVQDIDIAQVISHKSYNKPRRFWNDIALLRHSHGFNRRLNSAIESVCLPFGDFRNKNFVGQRVTVAGFGLTEPFDDSSEVAMKVRLTVMEPDQCAAIFKKQSAIIGDSQLCTDSESGKDSCSGDSGGPLMTAARTGPPCNIIGVVSFRVWKCGSEFVPGVYTRVDKFLNWIMDNMSA